MFYIAVIMSIIAAKKQCGGILQWDIFTFSEQIPNMTALNFSFRKDVVDDEIMNAISVNIGEVAGRQVYMHVVREAHQKYQGVFLDWQLC